MKMGSSQIDLQLQWDKYFEEARVIEYESLKKAASEINDYFHKNFWSWLERNCIDISSLSNLNLTSSNKSK